MFGATGFANHPGRGDRRNILQRPLRIARMPEVGARGAAMAAMIGAESTSTATSGPGPRATSSEVLADLYEEGFAYYLEQLQAARKLWDRALHATMDL